MTQTTKVLNKAKDIISLRGVKEKRVEKKIDSFSQKVTFSREYKNFRIRTAETASDLKKILQLRHEIFVKDLDRRSQTLEVDFDRYDLLGDHIMLEDPESGQVIGTYRLMASPFTKDFYSENEFDLGGFLQAPGKKIELGRACIHKDFRKGIILHLIWRGLAEYIKLVDARYLFGCSSVWAEEPEVLQKALSQFKESDWGHDYEVKPIGKYRFPIQFEIGVEGEEDREARSLIPALLASYLKAGAKIYGQPAWDRDFHCADIFTIMDLEKLSPRYVSKYFEE